MSHKKGEDINGWLIIDKPRDMGSTQVVNLTRRLFNAKKNGHAGTLDPFATGVLPIAFGEATKVLPYVTDGEKEYEFVLQFGASTNTDDSEGEIVEQCEKIPTQAEIEKIIPLFIGKIKQTPPMYSAIKINGQRAYKLAREGQNVEMPEREIEIFDLRLLIYDEANRQATFTVRCSKGTYVRTLGRDIALKSGSKGYLRELRRTKCGKFSIDCAILLEKIKNIVHSDDLMKNLLPLETSLRDIADLAVSEADAIKLKQGQGLSPKAYDVKNHIGGEMVVFSQGKLVAIVRIDEKRISPVRVFNL
ncbi:MAG: tRNA pseudouridine(55) synthase TruB [Alphaproteobacteria bacterium]|nr:tRNA pseudouridine(55) synthase TruB [Alphaproteobacteria bacterium]